MSIRFSIIIPLYNKEKTIVGTLNSVTSLDGDSYEVVVVDDGSTDSSASIVESFKSDRVSLYKKENGGVSSARNYGASKAKGEWHIFLDADDILFPDTIRIFSSLIDNYLHDEVFVANYQWKSGNRTLRNYCRKEYVSENPLRDIWLFRFYLRPGAFCCSRHAFHISGGYDERLSYYEDLEFCMRLASVFRIVVTPQLVMEYVTEENEARTKIHPINRNISSSLSSRNLNNKFVRYRYYRILCASIKEYNRAGKIETASYLQTIKREKYSKLFELSSSYMTIVLKLLYRFRRFFY